MALRNILKDTEPLLRKKSREVTEIDEKILTLLDDMKETLAQAQGVGLAAPQVTYIMHALAEHGMNVKTDATTIEEAATEIMRSIHG